MAREWLLQNVPRGTGIAREFYAPPLHSGDGFHLAEFFSLSDQSFELYCGRGIEYMLISSHNYNRYFEDSTERFVDERNWYNDLARRSRLVKSFEGTEFQMRQPTIEIRRLFCPA